MIETRRNLLGLLLATSLATAVGIACQAPAAPATPATPPAAVTPAATQPAAAGQATTPAPAPGAPTAVPAPASPTGTLRAATARTPDNLDPINVRTSFTPGQEFGWAVSDSLLGFDGPSVVPQLAEEWRVAPDNVTWTLRLRSGPRFSDGRPVTAADVKASYDALLDPANRYAGATRIQPFVQSIRAVDDRTVEFVTPRMDALFPARLTLVPVLSAASLQAIPLDQRGTSSPAASGSFQFSSLTNERLTITANPQAWRQPALAGIQLVALPEMAVRSAALRTGEVDLIASVVAESSGELRQGGFRIATVPNFAQTLILLDSASPSAHPALRDVRVRQAISLSINRPPLIEALGEGLAVTGNQVVTADVNGYDPALPAIPFDLPRARQLVQESGFTGQNLTMSGVFTAGIGSVTGAQAVAAAINATGLSITIEPLDNAVFLTRYREGGAAPMMLFSMAGAFRDADGALQNFRDQGVQARPTVRYSNPAFDAAYQATLAELDPNRRRTLLQQAVRILNDDWAMVPLGSTPGVYALTGRVANFAPLDQFNWNWSQISLAP